jgi:hypothetical protein
MDEPLPTWVAWIVMLTGLLLLVGIIVLSHRRHRMGWGAGLPSWAGASTNCLNAYIKRDYLACVSAGQEALSHQFIPTVGLVTILALRRLGRSEEAEDLGRTLLRCGFGPRGTFLLFMMLLDGALDPERFLKEKFFAGTRVEVTPEVECQVYFYWGAKLLTEGKGTDAMRPLLLSVGTECDALERRLADADLQTAGAQLPTGKCK